MTDINTVERMTVSKLKKKQPKKNTHLLDLTSFSVLLCFSVGRACLQQEVAEVMSLP